MRKSEKECVREIMFVFVIIMLHALSKNIGFQLRLNEASQWKQSPNRSWDEKDGMSNVLTSDSQLEIAR